MEWPSSNARSSDCLTSLRNSDSAAALERLWTAAVDGMEEKEEREDVRDSPGKEDVSDSESDSSEEESGASLSESSKSDAVSPGGEKLKTVHHDYREQ